MIAGRRRGQRAGELMDVLANPGSLAEGRTIVEQDPHAGNATALTDPLAST